MKLTISLNVGARKEGGGPWIFLTVVVGLYWSIHNRARHVSALNSLMVSTLGSRAEPMTTCSQLSRGWRCAACQSWAYCRHLVDYLSCACLESWVFLVTWCGAPPVWLNTMSAHLLTLEHPCLACCLGTVAPRDRRVGLGAGLLNELLVLHGAGPCEGRTAGFLTSP